MTTMADEKFTAPVYEVAGQRWQDAFVDKPQSQPQRRRHHTMTDNFGRAWETSLDITSRPSAAPVGPISTVGWHDPLNTPAHYKKFDGANMFRLTIDVDRWESDLQTAYDEWVAKLITTAHGMSPRDQGASLLGSTGGRDGDYSDVAPVLLQTVGPRPYPVQFVQALKTGNKWARGETDQVPMWARRLMAITAPKAAPAPTFFPDADQEEGAAVPAADATPGPTSAQLRMAKARAAKIAKQHQPTDSAFAEPTFSHG